MYSLSGFGRLALRDARPFAHLLIFAHSVQSLFGRSFCTFYDNFVSISSRFSDFSWLWLKYLLCVRPYTSTADSGTSSKHLLCVLTRLREVLVILHWHLFCAIFSLWFLLFLFYVTSFQINFELSKYTNLVTICPFWLLRAQEIVSPGPSGLKHSKFIGKGRHTGRGRGRTVT